MSVVEITFERSGWGQVEVTPKGLEGVDLDGDLTNLTDEQVLALGEFKDNMNEYIYVSGFDEILDSKEECHLFERETWYEIEDRYEQLKRGQ